jgi:hypothetical protein
VQLRKKLRRGLVCCSSFNFGIGARVGIVFDLGAVVGAVIGMDDTVDGGVVFDVSDIVDGDTALLDVVFGLHNAKRDLRCELLSRCLCADTSNHD